MGKHTHTHKHTYNLPLSPSHAHTLSTCSRLVLAGLTDDAGGRPSSGHILPGPAGTASIISCSVLAINGILSSWTVGRWIRAPTTFYHIFTIIALAAVAAAKVGAKGLPYAVDAGHPRFSTRVARHVVAALVLALGVESTYRVEEVEAGVDGGGADSSREFSGLAVGADQSTSRRVRAGATVLAEFITRRSENNRILARHAPHTRRVRGGSQCHGIRSGRTVLAGAW